MFTCFVTACFPNDSCVILYINEAKLQCIVTITLNNEKQLCFSTWQILLITDFNSRYSQQTTFGKIYLCRCSPTVLILSNVVHFKNCFSFNPLRQSVYICSESKNAKRASAFMVTFVWNWEVTSLSFGPHPWKTNLQNESCRENMKFNKAWSLW